MINHALKYASIGWHVIPCNIATKKPLQAFQDGKWGENFCRATKDPKKITEWWTRFPDALIGIGCGNSGLCVIDLDTKNGKNGPAVFEAIKQEDIITVEQITQSGGKQLIFKAVENRRIKQDDDTNGFKGIDTRNDGGYFIAPPSKMANGKQYEWISDQSPFEMDPIEIPEWLFELFKEDKTSSNFVLPNETHVGNRDDTLFRYACSLRSRNDLSFEQVLSAVKSYNADFCKPPIDDETVIKKVKQAFQDKYSRQKQTEFNDIFNAHAFISDNKEIARFCNMLGGWFIYNGEFWELDKENKILKLAYNTYKNIKKNKPEWIESKEDNRRWVSHVKSSGNERNIKSFINLSKMELSEKESEFDKNNDLICLKNGVFDLSIYKLFPFASEHLLTKQANVKFDESAKCDNWIKFLNIIFQSDKELISYIQKLCGYCLTADVSRQLFPILYGAGANGKSTFCLTLNEMLGDYSKSTSADTFMSSKSERIRNDIASLKGSRFVMASETERSKTLDTATIKNFTSDDPMQVRFLHKEFFEMAPTFKVFLLTNVLPKIDTTDDGTWRRPRLIPFNHKFEEKDKIIGYHSKFLYPEIPGIFNWCVEGLKKLNAEGECVPDIVRIETQDYKDTENVIGSFIEEYCEKCDGFEITSSDFWIHYTKCMKAEGTMPKGKHTFFNLMRSNGYKRIRATYGVNKGKQCFYGLKCRYIQAENPSEIDWED